MSTHIVNERNRTGTEAKGREGKEEGNGERAIMTECHFEDIMRRARARAPVYFIMESHHIGYTITILIRHNGYLRSSRWGRKRINVWPACYVRAFSYNGSSENKNVKLGKIASLPRLDSSYEESEERDEKRLQRDAKCNLVTDHR